MSEIISIPILELMEKTEQWLLNQGYKKNTLGVYKATWNKFRAYSSSPFTIVKQRRNSYFAISLSM